MNGIKLRSLTVKGYKSIKEIDSFEPKAINILVGPNGAGKSNFISFFTFLSWMLNSDGMLRTIALITLLGQNPDDLPAVLFLDEPELGLHPSAIDTVSAMIKAASSYCQIFIATQSVGFINNFELDDLVVIERKGRFSEYHRPDAEKLQVYLDEFSIGQIWEKNIIGGRP